MIRIEKIYEKAFKEMLDMKAEDKKFFDSLRKAA